MDNIIKIFKIYFSQASNKITLIGILVAGLLGYSGIKNNNLLQTSQALLVILEALAIAQILAGTEIGKVKNSLDKLIRNSKSFLSSRNDMELNEPFQDFVAQGHDILIMGISLVGTIGPKREYFLQLANQGIKFRFLLLNPILPCLEFAAKSHGVSSESLKKDIESSLSHLQQLQKSLVNNKQNIQYRLLNIIPDTSVVMRDGNTDMGVIRCELYLYKVDTTKRPAFRLTTSDGDIYYRFQNTVSNIWEDSDIPNFSQ